MENEEKIKKIIKKLEIYYPEHKIFSLDSIDSTLRENISKISKELNYENVDEFLRKYKFEKISGDKVKEIRNKVIYKPNNEPDCVKNKIKNICKRLAEYYPDKIISNSIQKEHKSLAQDISGMYQWLGYENLSQFLKAYGYNYCVQEEKGGRPKTTDPKKIIEYFKEKFPTGSSFTSAKELFESSSEYSNKLKTLSNQSPKVFGMSLNEYLLSIGLIMAKPKIERKKDKNKENIKTEISEDTTSSECEGENVKLEVVNEIDVNEDLSSKNKGESVMNLMNCLIRALEHDNISHVKIFCEELLKNDVEKDLKDIFSEEWENAIAKVESEFGKSETRGSNPISVKSEDYGLYVGVGSLNIRYSWGDFCDLEHGCKALKNTFKRIKNKYSSIEYSGLIAFPWSDRRSSDVVQFELSTSNAPTYSKDVVGKALAKHLSGSHLWECQEEYEVEDMVFVVTGKLNYFENREEILEYIEEIGATSSGSVSKKTSYLINNDITSNSSKNQKALELGIPIITEEEFLFRFGNPEDYDIEIDEFWDKLYMDLCDCDIDVFSELGKCLYEYREWIGPINLTRAFQSIIDIMCESDPEIRDELVEESQKILSGEF